MFNSVTLKEPVTLSGVYETTDGNYAQVVQNNGLPVIVDVKNFEEIQEDKRAIDTYLKAKRKWYADKKLPPSFCEVYSYAYFWDEQECEFRDKLVAEGYLEDAN